MHVQSPEVMSLKSVPLLLTIVFFTGIEKGVPGYIVPQKEMFWNLEKQLRWGAEPESEALNRSFSAVLISLHSRAKKSRKELERPKNWSGMKTGFSSDKFGADSSCVRPSIQMFALPVPDPLFFNNYRSDRRRNLRAGKQRTHINQQPWLFG